MALVPVTTWWLETTDHSQILPPARPPPVPVAVARAEVPAPELGRFLYTAVGGDWYWASRLGWTREEWRAWLGRPEVETWVATVGGTPAGYAELVADGTANACEITCFGLLGPFLGRGIGGHLLAAATERAWDRLAEDAAGGGGGERPPGRVWLHTCSLDGPHAKANYEARGFVVYRTETAPQEVPAEPPGPWPGAGPPPAPPPRRG